jgi:acyl-CoA reductase-like NAD-dependent aldehyde dehydrogenase
MRGVNRYFGAAASLPFGGLRQAFRGRENGREVFDACPETKSVAMPPPGGDARFNPAKSCLGS